MARYRRIPKLGDDYLQTQQRVGILERIVQTIGFTPDYPLTLTVNDGTRNRVEIGKIGTEYGIRVTDNAGNEVILAGGTIAAGAINISGATTFAAGYDPSSKVAMLAGNYASASSGARVLIFPDSNTGIQVIDNSGYDMLKCYVGGSDVGDVVIGRYATSHGMLWDKSAGILKIKGNLEAGEMSADRITTGTLSTSRIPNLSADKITTGTLSADRIAAGSIGASKLNVSSLSAITADLGTITAGSMSADRITAGTLSVDRIPNLNANKITAGTINATTISVTNLTASNINRGTLTVGGSGRMDNITIQRQNTPSGSGAYLRFEGGTRIWSDTSNRLGINSLGSPMYVYVDSTEVLVLQASATTIARRGILISDGRRLYLRSNYEQSITANNESLRLYFYNNCEFYRQGSVRAIIDQNIWTNGDLMANGSKPFVVPHPDGSDRYLRYTAQESPDVSLRYRGKGEIKGGKCVLDIPEHFILITETEGLVTVNLTAMQEEQGLYVRKIKKNEAIEVGGQDGEFMFEVVAIRKGYLNHGVEIDKDSKDEKELCEFMERIPEKNKEGKVERLQSLKEAKDEENILRSVQ
jgi:hypothetical protein